MSKPVIQMTDITKDFPGVKALDAVSFSLEKGEVRALVGKNGAGKSTLIKTITGVYAADSGAYLIDGEPVSSGTSPWALLKRGIHAIYQENDLVPFFTVSESIMLNNEIAKSNIMLDRKAMDAKSRELLTTMLRSDLDPRAYIKDLSVAQRQLVQIAKALVEEPKVLIFDEPTASLSSTEIDMLFCIINDLKAKHVSIIYISHRLEEIFKIADTVTVMRDGKKIIDASMKDIDEKALIRHISGLETQIERFPRATPVDHDSLAMKVEGLRSGILKGMDFNLGTGEILGVFGAEGAGQQDLAKALYGLAKAAWKTFEIKGKAVNLKCPLDAIKSRMGYVPRDRKGEGLVIDYSVMENITLAALENYSGAGFMNPDKEKNVALRMVEDLRIKTTGIHTPVRVLSGGNQQKVVLGRWLSIDLGIIVLDYPTAGIDVQAKEEVYRILRNLSDKGTSVLLITPEYEEIKALCDRVIVMRDGAVTAVVDVEKTNEEQLMAYAIGSGSNTEEGCAS
ncbi:MAG: sugar ABC transporter ATP-binding protein [Spirochaetota bacterium]